jgi:hypothetical protein
LERSENPGAVHPIARLVPVSLRFTRATREIALGGQDRKKDCSKLDGMRIVQHIWLIFPIINCFNAYIWWFWGREEVAQNPDLEPGYRRLILGQLIYGTIPFVIVGAGFELPRVFPGLPTGPFLIAFLVNIVAYWIAGFYWVFLRGGAEDLAAHPGGPFGWERDPCSVKARFACIQIGIACVLIVTAAAIGWWH